MKTLVLATIFLGTAFSVVAQVQVISYRDRGYRLADPGASVTFQKVIRFAGKDWAVKSSVGGRVGPGPNYFSDSPENVWVDDQQRLHLRITRQKGSYLCAEVVSLERVGYGILRWRLDSPVDTLDPNVVLGLFTWSDTALPYNGEIDIEFSRWGNVKNPNAEYVVQPFDAPGHLYRWNLGPGALQTTHSLLWRSDAVYFESLLGHDPEAVTPGMILQQWLFQGTVPEPSTENVRMNLWLYMGTSPSKRGLLEVIIKDFEFVPATPIQ